MDWNFIFDIAVKLLAVVLLVLTFSAIVKLPLRVSTRTSPVAVIPVGFTVPIVNAQAFT